jgi:hypothetical protein
MTVRRLAKWLPSEFPSRPMRAGDFSCIIEFMEEAVVLI